MRDLIEIRNIFGFPIVDQSRIASAHQYAAEVRERNKPPCQCVACQRLEREPAVMQLLANWKR